jgi:hypothetical protein
MLCFRCREREANPANFGTCDPCDDADPQAFALCRDVIGETSSDRTTRELLELPWRA